jgi:hypothetical protein
MKMKPIQKTFDELFDELENEYEAGIICEQRALKEWQSKGIDTPYVRYLTKKYANKDFNCLPRT